MLDTFNILKISYLKLLIITESFKKTFQLSDRICLLKAFI